MISLSPEAVHGARIPTPDEARAFARRPLETRSNGGSLSYGQRRVLSLATSDLLGFPVWAISGLERMPAAEVDAHVHALQARRLVDLGRVDGVLHVLPRSSGLQVKNRLRHVAKALGHGA